MSHISPWVKSHAWTSTIAALIVGLLLGSASAPETDTASIEAGVVSAQAEVDTLSSELSDAESENSELLSEKEDLSSDLSDLRAELSELKSELTVVKTRQPLPDLTGLAKGKLDSLASKKGWTVVYSKQVSAAVPAGAVLSQTPDAGETVHDGSVIRIVIAKAPPPPKPAPAPKPAAPTSTNCTPGYDPCLPPASDYDCAGGSGNGPEYTGPVRVTGSDPYGLDTDGDGWGCE